MGGSNLVPIGIVLLLCGNCRRSATSHFQQEGVLTAECHGPRDSTPRAMKID